MSGRTGKRMSPSTPTIQVNGLTFAVTKKQAELYWQAVRGCGIYIRGSEIRTARTLESIGAGKLEDNGELGHGNTDNERWYFKANE